MKTDNRSWPGSGANAAGSQKRRIFIVDDHPLICEALETALDAQPDLIACGHAYGAREALAMIESSQPHAILLDISLGGESGLELLRTLRASGCKVPVLALSMHREDLYADSILRSGGQGYIMKEEGSEAVLRALRKILDGGIHLSDRQANRLLNSMVRPGMQKARGVGPERLSDREREIFELVGRGMNSAEISLRLHISARTVETHRTHIKSKLGLSTRAEMMHTAIRWVEQGGIWGNEPPPAPPASRRGPHRQRSPSK